LINQEKDWVVHNFQDKLFNMLENQNCKILADSVNPSGARLTTILLKRFPFALLQEIATHRLNAAAAISPFTQDMSRNSASTRAIPLKKLIEMVKDDPFVPTFELNKRGMSGDEIADSQLLGVVKNQWLIDMNETIKRVRLYDSLGIHKSKPAKLLVPWLRIPIIVSSTNWEHFFLLRCAKSADVDLREQAMSASSLFYESKPEELKVGQWHIPFKAKIETNNLSELLNASAANIARVSYATHNGNIDLESNLELAKSLIRDSHMSPFEHIARSEEDSRRHRNFTGFTQYREIIEDGVYDF
jgi:hypothetical protein